MDTVARGSPAGARPGRDQRSGLLPKVPSLITRNGEPALWALRTSPPAPVASGAGGASCYGQPGGCGPQQATASV
ncbi:hypothetical protein [Streptomyces sp. NPDC006285]|uniref:hypothetical protein n=1 Tax=Streptomyces sp. NPDC006285 TaxID=3364742 RepID=UPI0036B6B33A